MCKICKDNEVIEDTKVIMPSDIHAEQSIYYSKSEKCYVLETWCNTSKVLLRINYCPVCGENLER